jgi:hypothetical protein
MKRAHYPHQSMSWLRSHLDLLPLVCAITLFGCIRSEEPQGMMTVEDLVTSLNAARLETEAAVQAAVSNAANARAAIIFVHVDWAPMEHQRRRFAEFAVEYQRIHPDLPVHFHYVDCTPVSDGYAPLRSLLGWQELEGAVGSSLLHGWGELVWMSRGRVLHVERILNFDSVSALIHKTEALLTRSKNG